MPDFITSLTGAAGGVGGVALALVAWLRSGRSKRFRDFVQRLFGTSPAVQELREGLDNLSSVVDVQGTTIDWLTSQLQQYQEELTSARDRLREMDILQVENGQLKVRISELEHQVEKLEAELARRRKYTPKRQEEKK